MMTDMPDICERLLLRATEAFYNEAASIAMANDVSFTPHPFDEIEEPERNQLVQCVRAAIEAAGRDHD